MLRAANAAAYMWSIDMASTTRFLVIIIITKFVKRTNSSKLESDALVSKGELYD